MNTSAEQPNVRGQKIFSQDMSCTFNMIVDAYHVYQSTIKYHCKGNKIIIYGLFMKILVCSANMTHVDITSYIL